MPLPFLLAGAAIAAGVIGAGGHLSAKDTNEEARRVSRKARELYDDAKCSLETAQREAEEKLTQLGYSKKHVLDTSMDQFLKYYDKIKNLQITESAGLNEISKFTFDQQDAIEIRKLTDIYSSSIKSGVTGAAAGAIIALAANGSLGIVTGGLSLAGTMLTGGLSLAGTMLTMGEVGFAASIAGSSVLSFGAAMTPLAAVAAPVVLFTGISSSIKADENLEKANTMYAEAEAASEKMKASETLCRAIAERSEMFNDLLNRLNKMFAECSGMFVSLIKKKEATVFKRKLTSADFSKDDVQLMAVTRALAKAVKSVIDTPILSKEGTLADKNEKIDQIIKELPNYNQKVEKVKNIKDIKKR